MPGADQTQGAVDRDANAPRAGAPAPAERLTRGREQFNRDVFPAELADITARRRTVLGDGSALHGPPRAALGLVGLALSGGGIRSASIALGVVQALARSGCLRAFDYLSTVSGGGYTGSLLSSVLNDPAAGLDGRAFPLHFEVGTVEPPAMRHIRGGSNYLAGGGMLNAVRLPAILLRGLLLNLVLLLPYIMAVGLATFALFPIVHDWELVGFFFWGSLLILVLAIVLYPVVARWGGARRTWDRRNESEQGLAVALLLFAIALVGSILSDPIAAAITTNWMHARAVLLDEMRHPMEIEDAWKWATLAVVLFGAVRASKLAESIGKRTNQLLLYALGLAGPLAAFGTYLLVLVIFARSPYLDIRHRAELEQAAARPVPVITDTVLINDLRANGLDVDATSRVTYNPHDGQTRSWTIHAGAEHTYRIKREGDGLRLAGTNFGRGLSRIALRADSAARPDSVGRDTTLDGALTRALETAGVPVLRDSALLAGLRVLGVFVDTAPRVAYYDEGGSRWWTIGPNRAGRVYRIDINPLPRGLIFADADLASFAGLRPALPVTADSSVAIDPRLVDALRARGASVDPASLVRFYPRDSTWVVRSSTVRQYQVMLKGRATGLSAPTGGREYLEVEGIGFSPRTEPRDRWFAIITLATVLFTILLIDVNLTSPHGFWRDRLSRVFLIRAREAASPAPNDALKLSELGAQNAGVPYHLVNTSLNLTGTPPDDLPGRGSDFFVFSRRFVGSYATGYSPTEAMEQADPHINLGTAMAISSAAVAPNSGTVTVKPLVPMLTMLNVRQDYWAPNPRYVEASSGLRRFAVRALRPGPKYLFREAIGQLHARGAFVNLSDGGHIENLAIYELLRRRCAVIVVSDGEHDPAIACPSLATLIRYARIDLGIEIDIDTTPLHPGPSGLSQHHWTLGTIKYGVTADGEPELGYLVYVKSTVTGDEAPYVADYRRGHPEFPHESTGDQFFTEAQFESYRALGYHAMNGALKATVEQPSGASPAGVSAKALAAVRAALGVRAERLSASMPAVG